MKKTAALLLLSSLTLFPTITMASVNVSISNNLDGSKNSVNVNSNTSVHQSNSSSNTTDVVIESNGEKKEYHSSNGDNVNMQSSDGNSKVNITNSSSPNPTPTASPKVTSSPSSTPTSSPSATPAENIVKIEDKKFDLLTMLFQKLSNLRNLFRFNFNASAH